MAEDKNKMQDELQDEQLDEVNGGGRYTVLGNEIIRLPNSWH